MSGHGDDPARLAAIDQQLAQLSDRMGRRDRAIMRSDVILICLAVAAVIYTLAAWPVISPWYFVVAWVIIAAMAAGGFLQALMLRSYRAEIRELRSRVPR